MTNAKDWLRSYVSAKRMKYVWPEKFGFKVYGAHPFWMGDEEQKDYIMKLRL